MFEFKWYNFDGIIRVILSANKREIEREEEISLFPLILAFIDGIQLIKK